MPIEICPSVHNSLEYLCNNYSSLQREYFIELRYMGTSFLAENSFTDCKWKQLIKQSLTQALLFEIMQGWPQRKGLRTKKLTEDKTVWIAHCSAKTINTWTLMHQHITFDKPRKTPHGIMGNKIDHLPRIQMIWATKLWALPAKLHGIGSSDH